jgi:integrase
MARPLTGSVYPVKGGHGIRWRENGRRRYQADPPFQTKTAARKWFRETVIPRLERGAAPSADITFDAFADVFLARHDAGQDSSTVKTLRDRLKPARAKFGGWTLSELEYAADDIAAWRATLTDSSRYRLTSALRQCLGAAVRWQYIRRNPAVDAGQNPQPRGGTIQAFTPDELDAVIAELDHRDGRLVRFAAETGLRPEEWCAVERRDLSAHAIAVERKFAKGRLTPYPKTSRSLRAVPLSDRAVQAVDELPPRLDTPLLFCAAEGGHLILDNWRSRAWYPALGLAGVAQRGPYALRHTFATEALASGIAPFELARIMGTSVAMIDARYGHLAHDSHDSIRRRLNARATVRSSVDDSNGR